MKLLPSQSEALLSSLSYYALDRIGGASLITSPVMIAVRLLSDGHADINSCDTSPTGLSSCNLRSAWALCLKLISQLTLSFSSPPLSFVIVLPSGSTNTLLQQYDGPLTFSYSGPLSITLSIASSSHSSQAIITGDAQVLYISSFQTVSLRLVGLLFTSLALGQKSYDYSILLNGIDKVILDHVTFSFIVGSKSGALLAIAHANSVVINSLLAENVHNAVIYIYQVVTATCTDCIFRNNTNLSKYSMATFDHVENLTLTNTLVESNIRGHDSSHVNLIQFSTIGNVILTNITANNNNYDGAVLLASHVSNVTIAGCNFNDNKARSILYVIDAIRLAVTNSGYKSNNCSDRTVNAGGISHFTGCNFTSNINHGVRSTISAEIGIKMFIFWCSFSHNSATAYGGAIYSSGSMSVNDCSFMSNSALYYGGAIFYQNGTNALIARSTFTNNSARLYGGAIYVQHSNISIVDCSLIGNSARNGGGGGVAFYGVDSVVTLQGSSFSHNSATANGGAICSSGSMSVNDCSFMSNSALYYGGAIHHQFASNALIARSTFTNNSARLYGGAIFAVTASNISIVDSSFIGNSAKYGGGVNFFGIISGITIQRTNLTRNIAQLHGGGVYFSAPNQKIGIVANIFSENQALMGSGGAMYFAVSCSLISIGGTRPVDFSTITADTAKTSAFLNKPTYQGHIVVPDAFGYYVVFDESTLLSVGDTADGIVISGDTNLIFQGGKYVLRFDGFADVVGNSSTFLDDDISLWPGIGGHSPLFVKSKRLNYRIYQEVDLFICTAFPVLKNHHPNIFTGNTASLSGGAIYWGDSNTGILVMPGTVFVNNSVISPGGSGGAIYMQKSNSVIHIYSSSFTGNTAYMGGAISLLNLNYEMSLYQCNFINNRAHVYGGATYLGNGNGNGFFHVADSSAIRFFDTVFEKNSAAVSGGAVYVANSNSLTCNNTTMTGNTANYSGGAVHLEYQNVAIMNYTSLSQNGVAGHGGAVKSSSGNSISFDKFTYFGKNYAGLDGGAVSMSVASTASFSGVTSFVQNVAGGSGGAILSSASTLKLGIAGITFRANSASQGSALRLDTMASNYVVISPSNSTSIMFAQNKCSGRGGTVSWVKDPSSSASTFDASAIPNFRRVVYRNNSAIFGINSSTQAAKVQLVGDSISYVNDYYSALYPYPTMHLLDYFSSKDNTDSTTMVTATVESYFCLGHVGYLSGVTTVKASKGEAHFANLTAFCFPGGNMTVKYTGEREPLRESFIFCCCSIFTCHALMTNSTSSNSTSAHITAQLHGFDSTYNIDLKHTFKFRQCVDGESLVDNQCQECNYGHYSFHYNPLQPTKECTACPPNTDACYGTTILTSPGYWRINKYSLVMSKCPFKSACHGGGFGVSLTAATPVTGLIRTDTFYAPTILATIDSPEGCARGHEGPLCAVCSDDHYFSSTSSTCIACQGNGQGQLAAMILVPLVLLIVAVYFTFTTFLAKPDIESPAIDDMDAPQTDDEKVWGRKTTKMKAIKEWVAGRVILFGPKIKIMLTVFQIISSFSDVLELQFTPRSTSLFRAYR
jgi:predicted outer membrane repeat protein